MIMRRAALYILTYAHRMKHCCAQGNGRPDSVNNVEQVSVAHLPPGPVSIEIRGANVPLGPQPYALVSIARYFNARTWRNALLLGRRSPAAPPLPAAPLLGFLASHMWPNARRCRYRALLWWALHRQVVSGAIQGVLQGPHNPQNSIASVADAAAQSSCAVVIVSVHIGPEGLTNDSYPSFTFSAEGGNNAASG